MQTEQIKEAIKASLPTVGSSAADRKTRECKEKLQSNSECTVWGKGGNALSLAALSSLDDTGYANWLQSVESNPEVIELEVAGIWTLLPDGAESATASTDNAPAKELTSSGTGNTSKAQALMDAYKAAYTFTPISTVFTAGRYVVFLRDDQCLLYDIEKGETNLPFKIADAWQDLSAFGFDRIDAAFSADVSETKDDLCTTVYAFRRGKCLTLVVKTPKDSQQRPTVSIPEGEYPKPLSEVWRGLEFDRIDAVLVVGDSDVYFFRGGQYVRVELDKGTRHVGSTYQLGSVSDGYPQDISERWVGVTFDRIDAAIYWGNGKSYFFREDQHVRYDMVSYRADPGYPKIIPGNYVEDWKFF